MSGDPRIESVLKMAERLAAVLKADIAALESGRARDMQSLEPENQLLAAQYSREAAKLNRNELLAAPAEQRARLTAATQNFHEALTLHTRMLTRVRRASEGLIKAVAQEVEKRRNRSKPYAVPQPGRPGAAVRPASASLLYNAVI